MIKLYSDDEIYMRPFKESDMKEPYTSWFYDQEVTRFNSHGLFPYSKEQKEVFVKSLDTNIVWAIMAKNKKELKSGQFLPPPGYYDDIHIGNISLQSINWINRSAEFAVIIGDINYWGKGICTQAGQWLFDHGFNKLNLNRIWSGTAAINTGMIKVFKKLGMKEEGRFRQGTYLAGDYYDILCYGILKNEHNR